MKPFDPYRLDRKLMRAAARETRALKAAGPAAYRAALEKSFASYLGRRYCLLTDSGRTALRLAVLALRPGGGTAAFPDITHPSLAKLGMRKENVDVVADEMIQELRDSLEEMEEDATENRFLIKRVEKRIEQLEQMFAGMVSGDKDQALTFAVGAGFLQDVLQSLGGFFAGHLHQSQGGDGQRRGLGPVPAEGLQQGLVNQQRSIRCLIF